MTKRAVPPDHPRAESLRIRERLIECFDEGVVAEAGLIAHGRGEAFDYLLGEKTTAQAQRAIEVAAALLLSAKHPVISVNGNAAALAARHIVQLAEVASAKIEVNLFYRSAERERAVGRVLERAGAPEVLGLDIGRRVTIPELNSERRHVDSAGIFAADVVLVPLEDGDRTEALRKMGKKTVAVDLNPLSRTAQAATVTIVDNIVRAMPNLVESVDRLRSEKRELNTLINGFDNGKNLAETLLFINQELKKLAKRGDRISLGGEKQ